ncbi:MAG TPA: hypothetical protein VGV89_06210 [Thermoplasmata archaeon]|nr:hypothetical protein [Thermoplasmata archaeon]
MGGQGAPFVRQLGRLYGRAMKLKNELLNEVTASAGLPPNSVGSSASIRSALLGVDEPPASLPPSGAGYPGIVTRAAPLNLGSVETLAYGSAMGPGTWSIALTSSPGEVVRLR